ncbi:unnamed protein product [Rhizoctonia solani]|uniref:F-box domain-containing protein n=1 Tax=Rhizoctonia solani TaxID=456999 RepID=A0A8H3AST0_9AGAM|nr:unnamed protein product [Rhizoctonia solani]
MVLPDELFRETLSYLWPVDISRFARTSKRSLRIADLLLYKRNHITMSLPPPRNHKYYVDTSPLLYACSQTLCELALTTHVPTAALTEFLATHPNLASISLPNQSPETVVELGGECVPRLTSITAPPALVACLVPERPVAHIVISGSVPREFMADVIESLAASSGPVLSLCLETEQVSLGVMQEITVRLRDLRSLWVKGRFMYRYSLTYSGLLLDMAPLLGRSSQLTSVSLIGWPAIRALPKSPQSHLSVSPSTPSASFTPSPSPPPVVDHSILEDELQVTRTFHMCAKQLREVVFPSGCRWVAKRDDDETPWEPARECHSARVWWVDRELELELAAAQQEAHRIEQLALGTCQRVS